MRAAVSWVTEQRHHGGVRARRAGCREEIRDPVVGGDFGSYWDGQVQAGDRDRETVPRRNNQRRLHAGRKNVGFGETRGESLT